MDRCNIATVHFQALSACRCAAITPVEGGNILGMSHLNHPNCITVMKISLLKTCCAILLLLQASIAIAANTAAATSLQTGEFDLSITLEELVGKESASHVAHTLAADDVIGWQLYVPENYDPASPAGIMVYISPDNSGDIPRGWKSVMDDYNLIWIAANNSGNRQTVALRKLFAILAPSAVRREYRIDNDRIYVSGLSGGGKMASMVATDYAQLFKGAIFNCGVQPWSVKQPARFEQIKENRYVFVTGTLDQALKPTKKVYKQYKKAGLENIKLMVIRDMTHRNPNAYKFAEALSFLDARLDSSD